MTQNICWGRQEIMMKVDKTNDVNWIMQFAAPILGIIFILAGLNNVDGFWVNFKQYALIYVGITWLVIGFCHRMLWSQKKAFRESLTVLSEATKKRDESPNQASHATSEPAPGAGSSSREG